MKFAWSEACKPENISCLRVLLERKVKFFDFLPDSEHSLWRCILEANTEAIRLMVELKIDVHSLRNVSVWKV